MIEEIEKRLADGEIVELECVDREGFLKDISRREANEKIIDQGPLVVDYDGDIRLVGGICGIYLNVIVSEEFKYFRIKEKPKSAADITSHAHKGVTSGMETTQTKDSPYIEDNPTFDDLIDVAVQAVKDEVVVIPNLKSDYIEINNAHGKLYGRSFYSTEGVEVVKKAIDWINSLYTETFVIESEEDINKVISRKEIGFNKKHTTVATLMNGNEILITKLDSDNTNGVVVYMRDGLYKNYLGIDVLKGATVTQKRGK